MGEIVAFRREKEKTVMEFENVFDVAAYLLTKESMNNKKLQKLCYYVQAWSLTWTNDPVFDQPFEAWVHGPVCVTLYHAYKSWGSLCIPRFTEYARITLSEYHKRVIDAIYDAYGMYTADQLEAMTHQELPWQKARVGYRPDDYCRVQISRDDMIAEYRQRL